ncbi:14442_t:CDS:2, partial [Cetraspora pellucida]
AALDDADNFGKRAVLNFRCKLIYEYSSCENECKEWDSTSIFLNAENQMQEGEFFIKNEDFELIWTSTED